MEEKLINKKILKSFLETVSYIADISYQHRVWIKGEGPECQSFDDLVCDFFDLGEPIFEDHKSFGIFEVQFKILMNFKDDFDLFCDKYDQPVDFIDSSDWKMIVNMAQDVLNAFNYNKSDVKKNRL